jgi:hypothetical protein
VRPKAATTSGTISGGRASSMVTTTPALEPSVAVNGDAFNTTHSPLCSRSRLEGRTSVAPVE